MKAARGASHPGHKLCAIVITVCGLMFGDFSACSYLQRSIKGVGVREVAVSVGLWELEVLLFCLFIHYS